MNNYTHEFVPIKSSASAIKTILPFPKHFECPVCTQYLHPSFSSLGTVDYILGVNAKRKTLKYFFLIYTNGLDDPEGLRGKIHTEYIANQTLSTKIKINKFHCTVIFFLLASWNTYIHPYISVTRQLFLWKYFALISCYNFIILLGFGIWILRRHLLNIPLPTPFATTGRTISRFGSCMRNLIKCK